MTMRLRDHPLRQQLTEELHARPFATARAPERATHLAIFSGESSAVADSAHLGELCKRLGQPGPEEGANHLMADFGDFRLKWERHTEFSSYIFFVAGNSPGALFSEPAIDRVPQDWLARLPGERLVGIHAELVPADRAEPDAAALAALFGHDNFAGAVMAGGAAAAWTDFAIKEDGFGRLLVHDRHLRPRQAGRLLQRLFEIETYRMMALLALPTARREAPNLTRLGDRLVGISYEMTGIAALEDERRLLDELTRLSQDAERIAAGTSYRFGAARAYYALVERRIGELREARIEGTQTISEFMERRLSPAMRTCDALSERLDLLSQRLTRVGQLLRTRVDIQLESQNRDLLRTMNRRAQLQLRLQQTVEGLSVAAITYYLVGLLGYGFKAAKAAGLPLNTELATGLAVVPVALIVWAGMRRLRRHLRRGEDDGAAAGG